MAKTRIKTTPTRMQKEALIASAAVTTTHVNTNVTEHVIKKRLSAFNHSMLTKEVIPIHSTIIVQPPKRTNSISSATSTISHTSDGGHSSLESPPPPPISSSSTTPTNSNGPTMAELTENAIKTLNAGLLAKSNALALKNRKVYMITEKCGDEATASGYSNGGSGASATGLASLGGGQKRKMYLIMEEKESDVNDSQAEKFMKSECNNGAKKLTLFTDTANGQLPQKIEKILPEILNCIQAKDGRAAAASVSTSALTAAVVTNNGNGHVKTRFVSQEINGKTPTQERDETSKMPLKTNTDKNERLPLTLPPKKNRTKIITTQIIPVNPSYTPQTINLQQQFINGEAPIGERGAKVTTVLESNNKLVNGAAEKTGATPVIVNATTLMANCNGLIKENGSSMPYAIPQQQQQHKNINLSTDFLFLMKMLPKLESIAETHKNYVKTCIEDLINKYSPQQFEDQ